MATYLELIPRAQAFGVGGYDNSSNLNVVQVIFELRTVMREIWRAG